MNVSKKRFVAALVLLLIVIPMVSASIKGNGGDYRIIVNEQAQLGHWYDNGFASYRARMILGQNFIGEGNDAQGLRRLLLGYIYMLNDRPKVTAEIVADKTNYKHPYTNDTLKCLIRVVDKNVGDRLNISVRWYKNDTVWYQNDVSDINYTNIVTYTEAIPLTYDMWPEDTETILHTLVATINFNTNTSAEGNIEPVKTKHYDVWKCEVDVFDGVAHSGWVNSSPLMVYNHRPDFDYSMPTYYEWPEDTVHSVMLSDYFSDIDYDDLNWYLEQISGEGNGRLTIESVDIAINNVTGEVIFTPDENVVGYFDAIFTAVDNRPEIPGWFLKNDDGRTSTHTIRFNVTQVNDKPWPSNVYISESLSGSSSPLQCNYIYNDIEGHDEDVDAVSYIWYHNEGGVSSWVDLGINSSTLSEEYFHLEDRIICSVRVKDTYIDYNGIDKSLYSDYVNSSVYIVQQEIQTPTSGGNVVIGVG